MPALYIGLMSGTSLDGVDAVLMGSHKPQHLNILGHVYSPYPPNLRREFLALNAPASNELHRAALAANAVAEIYADSVLRLLDSCGQIPASVRAIGAHGQTVRHRPGEFDGTGYTLQIINGALLAERCGIDVICDFRSRDVAAGGQGAPLVPAFHSAVFSRPGLRQAILNLGGIGNITLLDGLGGIRGFDCGPGNALLDHWCELHQGQPYDNDGLWASRGRVDQPLLDCMLAEPFLHQPPPKSTGRDMFNADWLDRKLYIAANSNRSPQDVQATLAELTVRSAVDALHRQLPGAQRLLVCGGGALNGHLMDRLTSSLAEMEVRSTLAEGIPPMQVEATAFAWLAKAYLNRTPANSPIVTGARGARVLGALYPAQSTRVDRK